MDDQGRTSRTLKPQSVCPTLRAQSHGNEPKVVSVVKNDENSAPSFLLRRLTPKECFRLQGFPDSFYENAKKAGLSDTQLYKQAGNAVSVNVIKKVAERLEEI